MKFITPLLLLTAFLACKSSKNSNEQSSAPKELFQEWKVSHEEGSSQEIVLRPTSFDFPLSRMREGFTFNKDNTLTYSTMGPADRPQNKKGTWEWLDDSTLKIYINEDNIFIWKVEKLNDEVFRVVKD